MLNSKNISVRSSYGLSPLSNSVGHMAKKLLGKRGFANADLLIHWPEIIGEELSKAMKPEKMVRSKTNPNIMVLHVRVANGAFAVMAEHQKKIILDKINTFLGYNAVCDIKIRQDLIELPAENREIAHKELTREQASFISQKLDQIQDETLKKRLHDIGMLIFFK